MEPHEPPLAEGLGIKTIDNYISEERVNVGPWVVYVVKTAASCQRSKVNKLYDTWNMKRGL